VKEELTS